MTSRIGSAGTPRPTRRARQSASRTTDSRPGAALLPAAFFPGGFVRRSAAFFRVGLGRGLRGLRCGVFPAVLREIIGIPVRLFPGGGFLLRRGPLEVVLGEIVGIPGPVFWGRGASWRKKRKGSFCGRFLTYLNLRNFLMRLLLLYHDGGCEKPAWGKKAGTFFYFGRLSGGKGCQKITRPRLLCILRICRRGRIFYGCASGGSSLCRSARILRISTSKPCCEGT